MRLEAWGWRLAAVLFLGTTVAFAQSSPGVVGEVRVHGNHTTPDAEVLATVGEVVGLAFGVALGLCPSAGVGAGLPMAAPIERQ